MTRWLGRLTSGLYGLLALGLIATGLYVSVGRELIPWVERYQAPLEQALSRQFKQLVTLERLSGRWQGFAPIIELEGLNLAQGMPWHLDKISVEPDLWQSLIQRQWVLKRLTLEGLTLSVRQSAEGRWTLDGLSPGEGPAPNWPELISQSKRLQELLLVNGQVTLVPFQGPALSLRYVDVRLQNGQRAERIDAKAILPDGKAITLNLKGALQAQDLLASKAALYLKLPASDWARWLPQTDWQINELSAGAELWASWANGQVEDAAVKVDAKRFDGQLQGRAPLSLDDSLLTARFNRASQALTVTFEGGVNGQVFKPAPISAKVSFAEGLSQLLIKAPAVELSPLFAMAQSLAPMPDKLKQVFAELAPQGAVQDLALRWSPKASLGERLYFSAQLDRLATGASAGVPAFSNISGHLSGGLAGGELELTSTDFSMHFDKLFAERWQYQQASGRLRWQLDDEAFSLQADKLALSGAEGQLAGDFMIRIKRNPAAESYMDLRVGMRQGDARYTYKYLPYALSPKVSEWLTQAIKAGTIEQGFFQYQGSLKRGSPAAAKVVSLFFDVKDAELAFLPDWPHLTQTQALVFVEPQGVRVVAESGRMLNSQVHKVQVEIPRADTPRLKLTGEISSNVPDALRILTETPLPTRQQFANWQGDGAVNGALELDLPLSANAAPARILVDFALDQAQVKIAAPKLNLEAASGTFRFDSQRGLSASQVSAKVLGGQAKGAIKAIGKPGAPASRLDAKGQVSVKALSQWLGVKQKLPATGRLAYQLGLTLDGLDSQLSVRSDLKGVHLDMPQPLGKESDEVRQTHWQMTLSGERRRYWLDYDKRLSMALEAPAKLAEGRGEVRLGGAKAVLPTQPGLWLYGELAQLDFASWRDFYRRYGQSSGQGESDFFKGAQLTIGTFSGFGLTVENLSARLLPQQSTWSLALNSQTLKGVLDLPKSQAPIGISLDYLKLPAPASTPDPNAPDPLAGFDPSTLPALNISIANLVRGTKALGHVRLKIRPESSGAALSDIDLDLMGLGLRGAAHWQKDKTDFLGSLSGGDLADVLIAWDYAPSISSQQFNIEAQGQWPGSPLYFALKRYSGTLAADFQDGHLNDVQGGAGALRVFGLLNFTAIGRRLRLDFSDLVGRGLSYDRFSGVLSGEHGVFKTQMPLELKGPSTNLELKGRLDMVNDRLNAKLLVALPLSNNLPLAGLMLGMPAIGGALFVVDKLLGDQVSRFATVQYDIKGSLADPVFSFDKPFEKAR